MKNRLSKSLVLGLSLLLGSSAAFATDGYFSAGYGTISSGFAGAGTAFYETSLIGGNPAGNVFNSSELSFGIGLFNPNRQYTITGNPSGYPGTFGLTPGTVKSDSKLFVMPNIGKNWKLNDNNALTLSIYGNGGMNTNYPTQTFYDQSADHTGVNLMQMYVDLAYSFKLGEKHSLGISALLGAQSFEAKGLASFAAFSSDATKLSGNGTDYSAGVGFKIGYMGELFNGFWLGAKYQSKIYMGAFKDYAGLFAEQGKFEIPSNWTVGIAYHISSDFTVLADVKQINYTSSKSVSNPMMTATGMNPLGTDNGAGFGWKDMTIYKIGFNYTGIDTWTLRAGYSYGKQPIPASEVMFNILAPAVNESHIALGFSKKLNEKGNALNFAFNYALNNKVSGPNPMEAPGQQTIDLEMNQLYFEIGFTF